jgi:MtfA peptidase
VEFGEPTLLNPYGLESPAEFFAVASECFFERPRAMSSRLPALYGILSDFYKLDPASWKQAEQ